MDHGKGKKKAMKKKKPMKVAGKKKAMKKKKSSYA